MSSWGVALAKAQFSELVEQAETNGPQEITRNGKPVAILVSQDEWNKKARPSTHERNMADFFQSSPLRGSGIDLRRSRSKARMVKF
jgi:prevent-host-death family protein